MYDTVNVSRLRHYETREEDMLFNFNKGSAPMPLDEMQREEDGIANNAETHEAPASQEGADSDDEEEGPGEPEESAVDNHEEVEGVNNEQAEQVQVQDEQSNEQPAVEDPPIAPRRTLRIRRQTQFYSPGKG